MPLSAAERFRRLGLQQVEQERRLLDERATFRKLSSDEQEALWDCRRVEKELREMTFPEPYHEGTPTPQPVVAIDHSQFYADAAQAGEPT